LHATLRIIFAEAVISCVVCQQVRADFAICQRNDARCLGKGVYHMPIISYFMYDSGEITAYFYWALWPFSQL